MIKIHPCTPVGAVLLPQISQFRRRALTPNKLAALSINLPPGQPYYGWYPLDINEFLVLLIALTGGDYSGIRVYYACYPKESDPDTPTGKEGQLMILFVPTRLNNQQNVDDIENIWIMDDSRIAHINDVDVAEKWIRTYRNTVLIALESDGRLHTGQGNYRDTHSHWYSRKTIAGDSPTDKGLIGFIKCMKGVNQQDNPVVAVDIVFAAFSGLDTPDLPIHQLTTIFKLRQLHDGVPIDGNIDFKNTVSFGSVNEIGTDTGVPCPPAGNCDGSFFP